MTTERNRECCEKCKMLPDCECHVCECHTKTDRDWKEINAQPRWEDKLAQPPKTDAGWEEEYENLGDYSGEGDAEEYTPPTNKEIKSFIHTVVIPQVRRERDEEIAKLLFAPLKDTKPLQD